MEKVGKNSDPSDRSTELRLEFNSLKKAGARNLADRWMRYPLISRQADPDGRWKNLTYLDRVPIADQFLERLFGLMRDAQLAAAGRELFALRMSVPPKLAVRRRQANRAYSGTDRQADTFYRTVEPNIIDELLHTFDSMSAEVSSYAPTELLAMQRSDWDDDLDRARVAFVQQKFPVAEAILSPYLAEIDLRESLPEPYLAGKTLRLYADILRDRGELKGYRSAQSVYGSARELHGELHEDRHIAEDELMLAVVQEMSGELTTALATYERMTADDRLRATDKARSELWVGTVMTKMHAGEEAVQVVSSAIKSLDRAGVEDVELATAFQKLAIAELYVGHIEKANEALSQADSVAKPESPLRTTRGLIARGHVLLVDRATRSIGRSLLSDAMDIANEHGLAHQYRTARSLLNDYELE